MGGRWATSTTWPANASALDGANRSTFLLGRRRTYEIFASYWPAQSDDDPFAQFTGIAEVRGVDHLGEPLAWKNSTLLQGDVAKAVAELKVGEGGNIVVLGSGGLVQTLYENDLVDEYALMIHPIVLGSGEEAVSRGAEAAEARRLGDDLDRRRDGDLRAER